MFGPNSRKECTLMINKSRKHEAKFVKMLAVEIIKPMIDKFISGEGWMNIFKEITAKTIKKPVAKTDTEETKETTDTNFVSVRGKAVKLLKCPKCDKTSYSSPGLKSHITKMHPKSKQPGEIRNKSDTKDDKIKIEADKIVDLLLNEIIEIIEINDDEECLDDITLEEVSSSMTGGNEDERKYICKCEFCAFEALSSKRYLAIQMLTKHKETCKTSKCVKCDFCVTDKNIMKRHMRDKHDVMSCSTSPPPKKKKDEVEEKEDEPEPMELEEECFVDLSKSLEDMDIENSKEEDRVVV